MCYGNEGEVKRGEEAMGWVEKGEETRGGKLSLICLSWGIFGLPLAINLVTLLCSDRGTCRVGPACGSVCPTGRSPY